MPNLMATKSLPFDAFLKDGHGGTCFVHELFHKYVIPWRVIEFSCQIQNSTELAHWALDAFFDVVISQAVRWCFILSFLYCCQLHTNQTANNVSMLHGIVGT